ncbi:MAG TPA: ABC transporter permease [Candidatus Fraserbacteria bacterium]|nr:ABC transporter permease [Candidatus Fraserbacteria bacterium]
MADGTKILVESVETQGSVALPAGRKGRWLRSLTRDKKALTSAVVLLGLTIAAIFAPYLSPYDPNAQNFQMLQAPSAQHLLGTDSLGRDLFSRILYGARVSLIVGISTVAIALIVGVLLGLLAGYYGGWLDMLIMRYIDLQWAFPNFIIAVYLVAIFGTGLVNVIVAVSLAFFDDFARLTRSVVLSIREEDYISAAQAIGTPDRRILWKHILPNAVAPIIVQATVSVSYAILAEAGLSFLGLGVKASTPSWGSILSDARSFIYSAWWLGVFPGLAIMVTVLSINFLGDGLRDILDVREYQEEN